MAMNELLSDKAGLDSLPEANVISDQKRYSGHRDCPSYRNELVLLDLNSAPKGRLKDISFGQRGRTPTNRVEKGLESRRRIQAGQRRKGRRFDDGSGDLPLPDDVDRPT